MERGFFMAKILVYNNSLNRICECVKFAATTRLENNPYKDLIIEAMMNGCEIGNYNQNQKIKDIRITKNLNK